MLSISCCIKLLSFKLSSILGFQTFDYVKNYLLFSFGGMTCVLCIPCCLKYLWKLLHVFSFMVITRYGYGNNSVVEVAEIIMKYYRTIAHDMVQCLV